VEWRYSLPDFHCRKTRGQCEVISVPIKTRIGNQPQRFWYASESHPNNRRLSMATYLTPIQVSVRTGIPKTTLAWWRRHGRGPVFVKRGARIEYPSRELEVWLQAWRREQAVGARDSVRGTGSETFSRVKRLPNSR
jgi:hypothetical protein